MPHDSGWYNFLRLQSVMLFDDVHNMSMTLTLVVTYHVYVRAFFLASESFMETYVGSSSVPVADLRYAWNKLSKSKKSFDRCTSSLTAIWFSNVFLEMLLTSTMVIKGRMDIYLMIFFEYRAAINLLMALSLVVHVDLANSRLKKCFFRYRDDVVRLKYGAFHDELLEEMEENYWLDLTVYAIFKIDRALILALASALVNFTVLLVQVLP
ncbi:hypothetical protein HDE_12195 [Halotydeus destructor]|nr:hypothetical protein HDE_12195 [Halotydeus destructor]